MTSHRTNLINQATPTTREYTHAQIADMGRDSEEGLLRSLKNSIGDRPTESPNSQLNRERIKLLQNHVNELQIIKYDPEFKAIAEQRSHDITETLNAIQPALTYTKQMLVSKSEQTKKYYLDTNYRSFDVKIKTHNEMYYRNMAEFQNSFIITAGMILSLIATLWIMGIAQADSIPLFTVVLAIMNNIRLGEKVRATPAHTDINIDKFNDKDLEKFFKLCNEINESTSFPFINEPRKKKFVSEFLDFITENKDDQDLTNRIASWTIACKEIIDTYDDEKIRKHSFSKNEYLVFNELMNEYNSLSFDPKEELEILNAKLKMTVQYRENKINNFLTSRGIVENEEESQS